MSIILIHLKSFVKLARSLFIYTLFKCVYSNIISTHICLVYVYFTAKHTKTLILSFMRREHHKQINKTVIGNMFQKYINMLYKKKWNKIKVWYNNKRNTCLSLYFFVHIIFIKKLRIRYDFLSSSLFFFSFMMWRFIFHTYFFV